MVVKESGVEVVVILNKLDVCDDVDGVWKEIEEFVFGVLIYVMSVVMCKGLKVFGVKYV